MMINLKEKGLQILAKGWVAERALGWFRVKIRLRTEKHTLIGHDLYRHGSLAKRLQLITQANKTAFKQAVRKKVMTGTWFPSYQLLCGANSSSRTNGDGTSQLCGTLGSKIGIWCDSGFHTPVPNASVEYGLFPHFISNIFRVSANSPA